MKLIWHGHSCFAVQAEGYTVVFDPYEDGKVPGCGPLRLTADAVYCSHEHGDHNARHLVTLTGRDCPLAVETLAAYHDDKRGLLRGKNTIHILSAEGLRVAHMGDLGHTLNHRTLEAIGRLDAVLLPVGGYYTIDARTANAVAQSLGARVVIPMHYRLGDMGFDVLGTLDAFTALRRDVRHYDTNTLELGPDTPAQTAVLTYGE